MDPIFYVLAWLAYLATVWSALLFDRGQNGGLRKALSSEGKFLRRLYARRLRFAAPQ
jgi:hypothetical protein